MRKDLAPYLAILLLVLFAALALVPRIGAQSDPAGEAKIAPEVKDAFVDLADGEMTTVIVTLVDQVDKKQFKDQKGPERQKAAVKALKDKASKSQKEILKYLKKKQLRGEVESYDSFWVLNGLSVTATQAVIQELASRADVLKITPNDIVIVPALAQVAPQAEANLSLIQAPSLWDLGFFGQGIVVANMDSGVDMGHPDLASRWRGGSNSWFDPHGEHPTTPTDLSGHGTWTMGVMVGGDLGGTAIGVAPQAQWIAVKIFDDQGFSNATAIHQGFQWLLDPDGNSETADAPHVVNNSWTQAYPGCDLEFELDLSALRSAGILPVFAAGNFGPNPATSASPANNPSALAVGAVDNSDTIMGTSSRGPSSCGEPTNVFPELVAPGNGIRTTDLFGTYSNASGTSLAAPHVSGALALLLSAFQDVTPSIQQTALISSTVDTGPVGPEYDYGYGRLDILAAYQWLQSNHVPPIAGLALAPNPTDGSLDIAVSAAGSNDVTAAEFFIGIPGPDGSGTPMSVNLAAPGTALDGTIISPTMGLLPEGLHTISAHSMDASLQWSDYATATLKVDQTGPTTSNVAAGPNPNNGSLPYSATNEAVRVDAALSDPLAGVNGGVNSAIQQVEGFINTVGADGSGFPLLPNDGLYDEAVEDAYAYIPLATIDALGAGTHQIYVHTQDASGNWGGTAFIDFVIETDLPVVSNVAVTPDSTDGTVLIDLTATVADVSSEIVVSEWFTGTDPGPGNGALMAITPNGAAWDVYAVIDAVGWAVGSHTVSVRARDAAGNWGLTNSAFLTVTEPSPEPELLYFSTAGGGTTNRVPGIPRPWDDADIYVWNNTIAEFSRVFDAMGGAGGDILPKDADIDGLAYDSASGLYIMSFNLNSGTDVPGLGLVQDEDVVQYDPQNGQWEMLFAGADVCGGLNNSRGQDISALDVIDGVLYFSPVGGGGGNKIGIGDGITGPFDDADIYSYEAGVGCSRIFDGSAVGLPKVADIDGLTVIDADTFYMSFLSNEGTDVPTLGLIPDESVVLYDAGTWSLYFDGSAQGLDTADGKDLDAIDVQ